MKVTGRAVRVDPVRVVLKPNLRAPAPDVGKMSSANWNGACADGPVVLLHLTFVLFIPHMAAPHTDPAHSTSLDKREADDAFFAPSALLRAQCLGELRTTT